MSARRMLYALDIAAIAVGVAAVFTARRHLAASEATLLLAVLLVIVVSITLARRDAR